MGINNPKVHFSLEFTARNVVIVLLSVATLFGLLSGLVYSLNLNLNSDMIVPALVAKEIVAHHNFQFFFPASDPYLFTDIYTFYLLSQALSGYSPLVLKLTAYFMFILLVGTFSYILYKYSGLVNALIFSALFTNLSQDAYLYYIIPVHHGGTLIATGFLLILFSVERIKMASNAYIFLVCLIAGLIVLSDSIFLAFFIIPWIIYYVYFYRIKPHPPDESLVKGRGKYKKEVMRASTKKQKERSHLDITVVLLLIFTALSYIVTSYFGENVNVDLPNFIPVPTSIVHLDTAVGFNFPLFINSLALLLNGGLYHLVSDNFTVYYLFISIAFVALAAYSLMTPDKNARYLYSIFFISAALIIFGFLFTDWAKGLYSARYLIFVALAVFAVIALAYRDGEKIGLNFNTMFLVLVFIVLISSVPVTVAAISSLDYQPEKEEHAFIDYLLENNFTYGFSDYWVAHDLTYLSGEQVVIRPIHIKTTGIQPISFLTTKRWYLTRHTNFVVITSPNDTIYDDMIEVTKSYPPNNTLSYNEYVIYHYTSNDTKDVKWFYHSGS